MKLSVGTSPQAVFPFGEQEAFVITNNGPWTVYVDQDSAVSEQSLPIPPTGSLAWDADRPLWLIASSLAGNGVSEVRITRNSQAGVFGNFVDTVMSEQQKYIDGAVTVSYATDMLECAAYDYVTVGLESPEMVWNVGDLMTLSKSYTVTVEWYDSRGNALGFETATQPGMYNPVTSSMSISTWKARGAYCLVTVTPGSAPINLRCRVTGTTRPSRPGMVWSNNDELLIGNPGAAVQVATADAAIVVMDALAVVQTIYLPTQYKKARVTYGMTVASGVAGSMDIRSAFDNNVLFSETTALPVAANSRTRVDYVLPVYYPVKCLVVPPTGPASPVQRVTFNFSD